MSFTLVFSQVKPCCKNKSGKGKLSCKVNHAQIEAKGNSNGVTDGSLVAKAGLQCPNKAGCKGCKCSKSALNNASSQQKCDSCTNIKWWQFWAKKKGCCSTKS